MGKYSAEKDLDLAPMVRWIVIANRTDAGIYKDEHGERFVFRQRLKNPKSRQLESELGSDRPGKCISTGGGGTIHHALDRRSVQHDEVAKRFARKIVDLLERAYHDGQFTELILAAEPKFLGMLRSELSDGLAGAVKYEVNREFAEGSDEDFRRQILEAIAKKKESVVA